MMSTCWSWLLCTKFKNTSNCWRVDLPLRTPNCTKEIDSVMKLIILSYTSFSSTLDTLHKSDIGLLVAD